LLDDFLSVPFVFVFPPFLFLFFLPEAARAKAAHRRKGKGKGERGGKRERVWPFFFFWRDPRVALSLSPSSFASYLLFFFNEKK
jgi:hypothetical protein